MSAPRYSVFSPDITETDVEWVTGAVRAGHISGSGGFYIGRFEREFASYCGVEHGVACSSGTTALHLAALLANIHPGDDVLVSACTNIATVLGAVQEGARIIPVDVERDTWNLDPLLLESRVTDNTVAIIVVHAYGNPADMRAVMEFAGERGLLVIEDAAEAHGATCGGYRVGSLADAACFSFYANKVVTTGEGGMVVTSRRDWADQARYLRNLAFGEPRFLHTDIGYNYRMTNLQAALGCSQMLRIHDTLEAKRRVAADYARHLHGLPLRMQVARAWAQPVWWMIGVVLDESANVSRDEFADRLMEQGIETRTLFCPMNLQPALIDMGVVDTSPCPHAEELWQHGLYLPSSTHLKEDDIKVVCNAVREALS